MRSLFRALPPVLGAALIVAACGSGAGSSAGASASPAASSVPTDAASGTPSAAPSTAPSTALTGTLVIYSGRSEALVGPLLDTFEKETGLDVQVKYAGTTALTATILEEGDRSPADVFFAQDAGALGAVAKENRLAALPPDTLSKVDPRFASDDGRWVGVSGRARVVIYDTRAVTEAELPTSIEQFTDPAWKGRIGWAPTNASFQSFVTAFRVLKGDDAATAWLEGIQANQPKVYEGNDAVLAAVAAGEVEVGFVNHYYLMRQLIEQGESFPVRNHFLPGGDVGSLVNVAGVGILSTSKNSAAAQAFVDFLLNEASQTYFATETSEYPLVGGVSADANLPPLTEIQSPDIDLSDLDDLEGTLEILQEVGVL